MENNELEPIVLKITYEQIEAWTAGKRVEYRLNDRLRIILRPPQEGYFISPHEMGKIMRMCGSYECMKYLEELQRR